MTNVKPVKGLGWSCGAISNSEWTGVLLRDVLENAGVNVNDPENSGIEHVQFEGQAPHKARVPKNSNCTRTLAPCTFRQRGYRPRSYREEKTFPSLPPLVADTGIASRYEGRGPSDPWLSLSIAKHSVPKCLCRADASSQSPCPPPGRWAFETPIATRSHLRRPDLDVRSTEQGLTAT